ncbi:hypothetical protein BTUL_0111g00350 [Botrytis tulipae]|uniref:Uncharacterized protein n=1 Tax=Botrytis tulipae TaxID=87230 RepID=A0A4Z1EGA1_9HELO|nr:hypothetical protein BTUL_0111g00350 [Botrytis tulipae]
MLLQIQRASMTQLCGFNIKAGDIFIGYIEEWGRNGEDGQGGIEGIEGGEGLNNLDWLIGLTRMNYGLIATAYGPSAMGNEQWAMGNDQAKG